LSSGPSEEAIVAALRGTHGSALLATELATRLRASGQDGDLDASLAELEEEGVVVVLSHPPPDVHLEGTDLRTVGVVLNSAPDGRELARHAAEECWGRFLRDFLGTHRCS
jgi:hypothetical protein